MITAQDIREKGFEKSKFNGYDMDSVDDFLEEIADSFGILQREKADLQKEMADLQKEKAETAKKMKVLVDKINDYRVNEEALNLALFSAQKLAVQIEAEARTRAAAMIADAEQQVADTLSTIDEQTAVHEKRLANAKEASAKFIEGIRSMCNIQLKKLDAISFDLPEASAAGESAVERIQEAETAPAGTADSEALSL